MTMVRFSIYYYLGGEQQVWVIVILSVFDNWIDSWLQLVRGSALWKQPENCPSIGHTDQL